MFYNENNEDTTVKQAAMQFDTFIKDGGVGATLFFVFIILIGVNAHSLHYLLGDGVISWALAIIGSIGFSLATTVIIRKPVSVWMKFAFPVFDMVLVFLGFNLEADFFNIHLVMTAFFAFFTGAILISIGTINFKENIKLENDDEIKKAFDAEIEKLKKQHESETNRLKMINKESFNILKQEQMINDELKTKQLFIDELQARYNVTLTTMQQFESETMILKTKHDKMEKIKNETLKKQNETLKKLNESENRLSESLKIAHSLLPNHILYSSWSSRKKRNGNRTAKDDLIEALADRIKTGETIEVNEFLKINN